MTARKPMTAQHRSQKFLMDQGLWNEEAESKLTAEISLAQEESYKEGFSNGKDIGLIDKAEKAYAKGFADGLKHSGCREAYETGLKEGEISMREKAAKVYRKIVEEIPCSHRDCCMKYMSKEIKRFRRGGLQETRNRG